MRPRPDGERLSRQEFVDMAVELAHANHLLKPTEVIEMTYELMAGEVYGHGFFPDRGGESDTRPHGSPIRQDELPLPGGPALAARLAQRPPVLAGRMIQTGVDPTAALFAAWRSGPALATGFRRGCPGGDSALPAVRMNRPW